MSTSTSLNPEEGKKKKKKPELPIFVIKNTADYQRMKLDRLFAKPDKPVVLPVRPKEKTLPTPPEFVRNIMGSSAGAGSGEFHVYRHLRRKEYSRQRAIQEKAKLEDLDQQFQEKLDKNKEQAELKTAKKRAKRLKKKMNAKKKAKLVKQNSNNDDESTDQSSSEDDDDDTSRENNDSSSNHSSSNSNSKLNCNDSAGI